MADTITIPSVENINDMLQEIEEVKP